MNLPMPSICIQENTDLLFSKCRENFETLNNVSLTERFLFDPLDALRKLSVSLLFKKDVAFLEPNFSETFDFLFFPLLSSSPSIFEIKWLGIKLKKYCLNTKEE